MISPHARSPTKVGRAPAMIFKAESPIEAWRATSRHLLDSHKEAYNVLVKFKSDHVDESLMYDFDPSTVSSKLDRIGDVANTIFPMRTWENSADRASFYDRYHRAHARGHTKSWGTYFGRFIDFGDSNVNQLENVIRAHQNWPGSHRAAFLMHASSAETDNLRPRGGPCLQYVQFNCPTRRTMSLTAVYRNHDYCNKALGNFFGLNRLLTFVCSETGRIASSVTCLSIHAYFDVALSTQRQLARL
ncbi:MAG: hypothetical protein JWR16_1173 [Nevskia sp.]|nr:hypothetical protein [Nevskia sp.]